MNSTLTATLARQVVMEGFVNFRLRPAVRRLVTRLIAIVPAAVTIVLAGESATGHLLVLSQVILSFALPFAVVPLVWFSGSRKHLGGLVASRLTTAIAWLIAVAILGLNGKLIFDALTG